MIPDGMEVDRPAEAGVYERNQRSTIEAGTKYASMRLRFPWTLSDAARMSLGAEALRLVVEEYRRVHGPVEWDFAEVITAHVTCQVIVELRVST